MTGVPTNLQQEDSSYPGRTYLGHLVLSMLSLNTVDVDTMDTQPRDRMPQLEICLVLTVFHSLLLY